MFHLLSHFTLSLSQLPTLVACLVLLVVLFFKRHTLTVRDYGAAILTAVLVFLLCCGALSFVHLPDVTLHLLN